MSLDHIKEERLGVDDLVALREDMEVGHDDGRADPHDVFPVHGMVYTVREVIELPRPMEVCGVKFTYCIRLREIVNPPRPYAADDRDTEDYIESMAPSVCFRKVRKPDISDLRRVAAEAGSQ